MTDEDLKNAANPNWCGSPLCQELLKKGAAEIRVLREQGKKHEQDLMESAKLCGFRVQDAITFARAEALEEAAKIVHFAIQTLTWKVNLLRVEDAIRALK